MTISTSNLYVRLYIRRYVRSSWYFLILSYTNYWQMYVHTYYRYKNQKIKIHHLFFFRKKNYHEQNNYSRFRLVRFGSSKMLKIFSHWILLSLERMVKKFIFLFRFFLKYNFKKYLHLPKCVYTYVRYKWLEMYTFFVNLHGKCISSQTTYMFLIIFLWVDGSRCALSTQYRLSVEKLALKRVNRFPAFSW